MKRRILDPTCRSVRKANDLASTGTFCTGNSHPVEPIVHQAVVVKQIVICRSVFRKGLRGTICRVTSCPLARVRNLFGRSLGTVKPVSQESCVATKECGLRHNVEPEAA